MRCRVKLHRSAESDPAAFEIYSESSNPGNTRDLIEHPLAAAFAIRGARGAFQHATAFEDRHAEFGPADIDCERAHS